MCIYLLILIKSFTVGCRFIVHQNFIFTSLLVKNESRSFLQWIFLTKSSRTFRKVRQSIIRLFFPLDLYGLHKSFVRPDLVPKRSRHLPYIKFNYIEINNFIITSNTFQTFLFKIFLTLFLVNIRIYNKCQSMKN